MKNVLSQNYDLRFKPCTYWGDLDNILSNIKGEWRRHQIKNSIGDNEPIPAEFLQNELPDTIRDALSRIHPSFMGGEFLPNYEEFEIEIARVVYESVTNDVISLRASPGRNRIHYRIVDEYDMAWILDKKSSLTPLTLKQLIKMLLNAYVQGEGYPHKMLMDGTFFFNYYWEWESIEYHEGFMTVASGFYPQLEDYFNQMENSWLNFCDRYHGDSQIIKLDEVEIFRMASGVFHL